MSFDRSDNSYDAATIIPGDRVAEKNAAQLWH
jgi:hypothetical protein